MGLTGVQRSSTSVPWVCSVIRRKYFAGVRTQVPDTTRSTCVVTPGQWHSTISVRIPPNPFGVRNTYRKTKHSHRLRAQEDREIPLGVSRDNMNQRRDFLPSRTPGGEDLRRSEIVVDPLCCRLDLSDLDDQLHPLTVHFYTPPPKDSTNTTPLN